MKRTVVSLLLVSTSLAGCMVGEDEATDATGGASIGVGTTDRRLTNCKGKASTSIPADNLYVITTFGGPGDEQPMSCGGFADGTGWYAASRQRYGCGAKLAIRANGKCVVVKADDYGPDVCVENAVGKPIIDVSPRVTRALFGISGAGWSDRLEVSVEEVAAGTPVGPCAPDLGGGGGGGGGEGGGTPTTEAPCQSATLDREVEAGTCVQSATDDGWYKCTAGEWVATSSTASCTASYGHCESATLGIAVPARTCVQARSNSTWYQCNGQGWVKPVDVAAQAGPIGTCATMHPL